jgi:hypothetical protein
MNLLCMCWNVRNLSENLMRPGVQGRGVPFAVRLHQVASYVGTWKPHLLFILETGPDARSTCKSLNLLLKDWMAVPTAENDDGETCVALIHKSLEKFLQSFGLYGKEVEGYRRSARLLLSFGKKKVCFLVLHPPSPRHSLETRIKVISQYAQEGREDSSHKDYSIVLCGDLNIRAREFSKLAESLGSLGYSHVGPKDPKSKKPVPTSLRKFTTIMITEGDTESEPYDQVWLRPAGSGAAKVSECLTFTPDITLPVLRGKFAGWLATHFQNLPSTCIPDFKATRPKEATQETKDITRECIKNYLEHRKRIEKISQYPKWAWNLLPEAIHATTLSAMATIAKVDKYLIASLPGFHPVNSPGVLPANLGRQSYQHVTGILKGIDRSFAMAINLFHAATGGAGGLFVSEANAFEFAISDHQPVSFRIELA